IQERSEGRLPTLTQFLIALSGSFLIVLAIEEVSQTLIACLQTVPVDEVIFGFLRYEHQINRRRQIGRNFNREETGVAKAIRGNQDRIVIFEVVREWYVKSNVGFLVVATDELLWGAVRDADQDVCSVRQ